MVEVEVDEWMWTIVHVYENLDEVEDDDLDIELKQEEHDVSDNETIEVHDELALDEEVVDIVWYDEHEQRQEPDEFEVVDTKVIYLELPCGIEVVEVDEVVMVELLLVVEVDDDEVVKHEVQQQHIEVVDDDEVVIHDEVAYREVVVANEYLL